MRGTGVLVRAPKMMLTATADGRIVRAVRDTDGWSTDTVLADVDVRALTADPRDEGVLYAGTQGQGVWRSTDAGASWAPRGLDGKVVKALAVSPVEPGLVWAGLKPADVAVTRDGGKSWEPVEGFRRIPGRRLWWSPAEPPGVGYVQALAASPVDADVVIAGIEVGGVVLTRDGGTTWERPPGRAILDCHSLAAHASNGNWFYQGANGMTAGATVTRDAGRAWEKARAPGEPHYGWAVAADPVDPETWYFTAAPGPQQAHRGGNARARAYRVRGTLGTPELLTGGLPTPSAHMMYGLATLPDAPGHVWLALANGHVWHSADHGATWTRENVELASVRYGFLVV